MTPKCTSIWYENNKAQNLANAIWTIIVKEILINRTSLEKIDFERVTKIVKGETHFRGMVTEKCGKKSRKNVFSGMATKKCGKKVKNRRISRGGNKKKR